MSLALAVATLAGVCLALPLLALLAYCLWVSWDDESPWLE